MVVLKRCSLFTLQAKDKAWLVRGMVVTSENPKGASASSSNDEGGSTSGQQDGSFECNICLDTAKDAVVSLCGHLFW
ncbi:hypothetical protein HPB51_028350 [Rhipicephalus microplus]|uniref:RING-type E3 ubiquitin transferase n=1 Tax=Rhipicephalus microplus TaxID=6941 RepID=A0A9J6CXI6_RHIMP|nr:hypothetical protein HPB51_028350 [Rhipicephalus microplus]